MTGLRTRFFAVLLAALWLLPQAARAGDVMVDYSQLEPAQNDYMPLASVEAEDFSARAPIHLHPLTAAMTSPTVKNLAAEDTHVMAREEIHLHPPAPKVLAAAVPTGAAHVLYDPAQTVKPNTTVPPTITQIDLALAAVPAAPRTAKVEAAPTETASVTPPADVPTPPAAQTDIALDNVIIPAKPTIAVKEDATPEPTPLESNIADAAPPAESAPVTPIAPKKSADDDAPAGFMRVNAVAGKMDDLTPADVVGLDLGAPEKQTDN